MRRASKTACTKVPFCPAFSCDDANCKGKLIKTHRAQEKPQERVERSRLYNTAAWTKLRQRQLGRDPLCQRCLTFELVTPAVHVDHVIPHRGDRSKFFDATNLQSLCHSCHSFKTNRDASGSYEDYRSNYL